MAQVAQGTEARHDVIYTATTHTTGGRDGRARSSDGQLEIRLSSPGSGRPGTNPEQLFASGWSACFEGALALVAQKKKMKLPAQTAIDAEVDLHHNAGEFYLSARLNISLPEVERSVAESLVEAASHVCPYSKAIKGNIEVSYNVV
jgi:Ohr subfamily peroxiredoxin